MSYPACHNGEYRVPTDAPEADGTFAWSQTRLVVVEVDGGGKSGLGYTYGPKAVGQLVEEMLAREVEGEEPRDVPRLWEKQRRGLRNAGQPGLGAMALAAVDAALWDLKAKLFHVPLVTLLGAARDVVPVYGSGGFTSYDLVRLRDQLGGLGSRGFRRVKTKVGAESSADLARVRAARQAIGPRCELFGDANGAYARAEALGFARDFAELDVRWFEEPVSSNDLDGLHFLHDRAPPGMAVAAGEYGSDTVYFRRLLEADAVHVLQADGTRCGGITGFLRAAVLCEAFETPLSAHCAPALHLHACCAAPKLVHLEYFHDHARLERMLFDGMVEPVGGALRPDLSRPGLGLELRRSDVARFAI